MRLSPEKSAHLAQLVATRLVATRKAAPPGGMPAGLPGGIKDVEVKGTETGIRMKALESIRKFIQHDEVIAEAARQRVRSLRRGVPEGSPEWNTLFQQQYEQEMNRLRKVK